MQAAWPRGNSNTSAETATPLRSADLAAIGAMVLDSPRVHAVPSDLAPGSSAGSSIDEEAGTVSPGKMGPTNFELLRVVGQGAFGKVLPCSFSQRSEEVTQLCAAAHWHFHMPSAVLIFQLIMLCCTINFSWRVESLSDPKQEFLQDQIPRSVHAAVQVFQVRKKDTGQIYAMKVMRKDRILAKDHGDYVRTEREVLTAVFHPYIVTLRCSFQVPCPSITPLYGPSLIEGTRIPQ